MFKYAFIMNVPGQSPEKYSAVYETSNSYNVIAGTGDMDMAKDYVKSLIEDGFTVVNLCGDFDDKTTEEMCEVAGPGVKIRHADYFGAEADKINNLESLLNYGIIVLDEKAAEPNKLILDCDDCKARIVFAKDLNQAKTEAADLVAGGIDFIELCSWFDKERTCEIIDAVKGAVPVGTCGVID